MMPDADALARQLDVSRETIRRLQVYVALLEKWNPKINLVSSSTLSDVWARHIMDSAQLLAHAPVDARTWVDLGSGGGFPGAVIAILAVERRPDLSVTLIEADQRKAAFLRTVGREAGVTMKVIAARIEEVDPLMADVVSARALAPLTSLLDHAARHSAPGGVALFLKGARAEQEVQTALEAWRFGCEMYPSKTDKDAVILKIGGIERV